MPPECDDGKVDFFNQLAFIFQHVRTKLNECIIKVELGNGGDESSLAQLGFS